MKLSKALLGAILIGVSVQTTMSSCNKKEKEVTPQANSEQQQPKQGENNQQDPCPACGMG